MNRRPIKLETRPKRAGQTLLELVVATTSAVVLMGGLSSSIYIASQSLDVATGSLADTRSANTALEAINRDLQSALTISELTATTITMSVPDRDGDSVPETIRYAWSGVTGDPLTQSYNGSTETNIARDVQSFSLAAVTRLIEGVTSLPIVLFVSGQYADGDGGLGTPTAAEQDRIDLIEGWGYDVTVISQEATQAEFDAELEDANVVYVSGASNPNTVGTKLNAATTGVVTESMQNAETLGFYSGLSAQTLDSLTIEVENNTHYITSSFALGTLSVCNAAQTMKWTLTSPATDAAQLADANSGLPYPCLLTLDTGDELADSSAAAGRRCQLPWGESSFDATQLTADGQTLMQRALEWAAGAGDDTETEITGIQYHEFTDTQEGSDVTSITVAVPPGYAAGDLLIAAVATDGNTTSSLSPPSGWNQIVLATEADEKVTLGVWWKLASASESSYNFTWSGGERAYGWVMRFSGHDPSNPIHATATNEGENDTPVAPAVTTTVDDALVLRIGGFDSADITAGDPGLPGLTPITMQESGGSSSRSVSGGAGFLLQTTAGDSGTADFDLTGSEEWRTVTIAIAPDPSP